MSSFYLFLTVFDLNDPSSWHKIIGPQESVTSFKDGPFCKNKHSCLCFFHVLSPFFSFDVLSTKRQCVCAQHRACVSPTKESLQCYVRPSIPISNKTNERLRHLTRFQGLKRFFGVKKTNLFFILHSRTTAKGRRRRSRTSLMTTFLRNRGPPR